MSSIGSIMKGLAEKFSDLIARIDKINENDKSLITFSLCHIGNTMNDINGVASSRKNCDRSGKLKAGHLQDRLASQEG
jgi:hypothetical protein